MPTIQAKQDTLAQAYYITTHTDTSDVAKHLSDLLAPQLTALIAGVDSPRTVARWASRQVTRIPPEKEERLRAAYIVVQLLSQNDQRNVVRAWFIGMNPQLDDSPARALRDGRLGEVLRAARVFTGEKL